MERKGRWKEEEDGKKRKMERRGKKRGKYESKVQKV